LNTNASNCSSFARARRRQRRVEDHDRLLGMPEQRERLADDW
jgi:hypothetical protein